MNEYLAYLKSLADMEEVVVAAAAARESRLGA